MADNTICSIPYNGIGVSNVFRDEIQRLEDEMFTSMSVPMRIDQLRVNGPITTTATASNISYSPTGRLGSMYGNTSIYNGRIAPTFDRVYSDPPSTYDYIFNRDYTGERQKKLDGANPYEDREVKKLTYIAITDKAGNHLGSMHVPWTGKESRTVVVDIATLKFDGPVAATGTIAKTEPAPEEPTPQLNLF